MKWTEDENGRNNNNSKFTEEDSDGSGQKKLQACSDRQLDLMD
tara:strand:- start:329 stop:457 length:129 start_codon:yes stop_codon:yes gene_type:complete